MQTYKINWRMQVATELVRHLAIVAAVPNGEDSAGRQKFRLMTPKEVARRAVDIADELWSIGVETGSAEIAEEEKPEEAPPF